MNGLQTSKLTALREATERLRGHLESQKYALEVKRLINDIEVFNTCACKPHVILNKADEILNR